MIAYHFARADNRLGYDDNRPIKIGKTLKVDASRIVPCQYGLHASTHPFDALQYAAGPRLYRVELGGKIIPHGEPVDKYVASERTAIGGGKDASPMLRTFARACALDVIDLWDAPEVVREYLRTGDETLRDAAWVAAKNAARDAAKIAAWAAARDAAKTAAWDAAEIAARAAAAAREATAAVRDAARAAAWATAARAAAARDFARGVEWSSLWSKQREWFASMCLTFLDSE
jgi:hypothetical protein